MLSLADNKVKLWRYKIEYGETVEYATSEEEKEQIEQQLNDENIEFTTTDIDQTGNEWLDGKTFSSRDEAVEALNNGEDAYNEEQKKRNDQLRADIDFIAIMKGVEL